MQITVLASGSTGNCSIISDKGTNLLLDVGISMKRVREGLVKSSLNFLDVSGILITHEHSDHISGLQMILKHYDIPVYTTELIAKELEQKNININRINTIKAGEIFYIGNIAAEAFKTPHDSKDSVGFVFGEYREIGFATDTGCITDDMMNSLKGVTIALIEANHDIEMLKNGRYPAFLKKRILSEKGHLSNDKCGDLARYLESNGTKKIVLGHLSKENNTPEKARMAVKEKLCEQTELYVAPMLGFLEVSL